MTNHSVEFSNNASLFLLCEATGGLIYTAFRELSGLYGAFGNPVCALSGSVKGPEDSGAGEPSCQHFSSYLEGEQRNLASQVGGMGGVRLGEGCVPERCTLLRA